MTYPFFPTPPGIPPGTPPGGGGFGRAEEGDAGDGGAEAEAEGAGDAGAAGAAGTGDAGTDDAGDAGAAGASSDDTDAGDAGAAGASSDDAPDDAGAGTDEGGDGGDGDFTAPTETDFVSSESLGGGSGTPGSGGAAGEGYIAPVSYTQTFRITNNGGGNARIRSINFSTPEGIQHVADLTDFGSTSTFSEPLFTTSTIITTGTSKTFIVGYNYQYGGLGTRTGSILIRGSGGIELRSNITLIIAQEAITAGGISVAGGSGTGGGGTGGGYTPPAEGSAVSGATAGTSLTPLEDQFSQPIIFYDIS